jgi:hypothetical protein
MHKIEQATFTHEIKWNVQLGDILILKNKKDPAAVVKVYTVQHMIGGYYKELTQNTP